MKMLKLCLVPLMFAAGSARADDIIINLDATTLSGSAGSLLSFNTTITSVDMQTIDLNDISVSLPGMFTVDQTPFLLGPPTVGALGTTADFTLFTVTIDDPYTDPFGPVAGTVTILGGLESGNGYDPSVMNYLGQTGFTVNAVASETSDVPEVSTVWMLSLGIVCLWLIRRRRRAVGYCRSGTTRIRSRNCVSTPAHIADRFAGFLRCSHRLQRGLLTRKCSLQT
jgi:hypothetical protein